MKHLLVVVVLLATAVIWKGSLIISKIILKFKILNIII